jgi:hypothetical protein
LACGVSAETFALITSRTSPVVIVRMPDGLRSKPSVLGL